MTGDSTFFNNDNTEFTDLPRAAVASASIGGVFPPFVWGDGRMFMDGGAVHNVNAHSAIDECMKLVDITKLVGVSLKVTQSLSQR